jgi:hypothetical protein
MDFKLIIEILWLNEFQIGGLNTYSLLFRGNWNIHILANIGNSKQFDFRMPWNGCSFTCPRIEENCMFSAFTEKLTSK